MNIYGNTEDSNQHLVKKTFMHENLNDFDSIKGFLDHEEGIFYIKWLKNIVLKLLQLRLDLIVENQHATSVGCKENRTHLVTIDHHRV